MNLNSDQQAAVSFMLNFLHPSCPDRFALLSGAAGTGKTTTILELAAQVKGRIIFTAPTNKATKVLRETFKSENFVGDYTPECRTIYSLLGLRMEPNGEIKELVQPEEEVDLSKYRAVVVDEGSMISDLLLEYIKRASDQVKFIFMADYFQLPPITRKENVQVSPIWNCELRYDLTKVMRHDNQILSLATTIRERIDNLFPQITINSDNDPEGGVWKAPLNDFISLIQKDAHSGLFSAQREVKAIAWRNATVDQLNLEIRKKIFSVKGDWFPGDRIIMMEPAADIINKQGIATTDDEGTIERMDIDWHPTYPEIKCFRLLVQMDYGHPITLWKVHPDSLNAHSRNCTELAALAKEQRWKWKDYWKFRESFHNFRYSYAITAHRAQGSTYTKVFVHSFDILQNRNRNEAFRCLYVACTRPRKELIIT